MKIIGTIVTDLDGVEAWVDKAIEARVMRSEAPQMCGKVAECFGELMGRISAIGPTQARAASGESFKFASEKTNDNGDVVELPNTLPPRRAIN